MLTDVAGVLNHDRATGRELSNRSLLSLEFPGLGAAGDDEPGSARRSLLNAELDLPEPPLVLLHPSGSERDDRVPVYGSETESAFNACKLGSTQAPSPAEKTSDDSVFL
jgi:hypothetical protein